MYQISKIVCGVILLTGVLQAAPAQYSGWQHSGSIYLLTTPQGANLPASASEDGFPLLVRLDKYWFNFSQAKANGEDIRFAASTGSPLAYQIDQWDAAAGSAGIWVRIPTIKGNAHQEIKLYWGKADAKSESNGKTVFNESNGYLSVWHMDDPAKDAWAQRTPDKDEKPVDNQFYARDDKNEGTLYYNGILTEAADSVFLKLYADDKLVKTESRTPKADKTYAFAVKLQAGLTKYKVEFGIKSGSTETVRHTVNNLVCGDAYIIQGQSNAVAYNYANETKRPDLTRYTSPWIRSFGGNGEAGGDPTTGGWGDAVVERLTPTSPDRIHFIGVWGMAMAKKLVEDQKMPICILNGAVGGTRIDQHMPDPANHYDTTNSAYSIYRNLMKRVVATRLTHGIRGVLWHQGESDQGFDGPDNCFGCDMYEQYFVDLSAAWKQDYPNIRHYYLFQIWPNSCSMGGNGASDRLRDVERRLPRLYSSMSVVSTLDLLSGACHFDLADYEKMGRSMASLVARDNYGKVFDKPITSPDLKKAYYTSDKKEAIALEFDQPMAWNEALTSQFYLDGKEGKVASGAVSENVVTLKLAPAGAAKTITYLIDKHWDIKNLLYGQTGIAALTFCEVPLEPAKPNP